MSRPLLTSFLTLGMASAVSADGIDPLHHWAFAPPTRPVPPEAADAGWAKTPVDRFVRERLEREGLAPRPEAPPAVLLRRLSLDLTGLPPAPEETRRFTALWDAAGAAERDLLWEVQVDERLAAPAYGERWASPWLDLARYADSMGYARDEARSIWAWRDWVVEALNRNLPYDRFTVEQLAGDLLPDAGPEQRLATAFHRNTPNNTEGGSDNEEYRVAAVKDRVNTTLQAWMGLTAGCAECHDHAHDPLSQEDYYRLYAIFNQTADADTDDDAPVMAVPGTEEIRRRAELQRRAQAWHRQLRAQDAEALREERRDWEARLREDEALRARLPRDVQALVEAAEAGRSAADETRLADYHRAVAPGPARIRAEIAALQRERAAIQAPTVPVMAELPDDRRRETRLLPRGHFLEPGGRVEPGVPAAFHPLPEGSAPDRLGLARWILAPENPLAVRVAANRLWAGLFGRGLVNTPEDFGRQGAAPSHPELLDWLAVELRENGWDQKALLKGIAMSATYRQDSAAPGELYRRDPENILLARGSRVPLTAEQVRDQALALSGLLSRRLGGPPVHPPQPPGQWRGAFSEYEEAWPESAGEDRYRRALYTFWRRGSPYPGLASLGQPSRETCEPRRVSARGPLQALATLNDPAYVEMARAMARRILSWAGQGEGQPAARALELALGRPPTAAEEREVAALYRDELARYQSHPAAARTLSGEEDLAGDAVELAAWTAVAIILLNLDAVLTRS